MTVDDVIKVVVRYFNLENSRKQESDDSVFDPLVQQTAAPLGNRSTDLGVKTTHRHLAVIKA